MGIEGKKVGREHIKLLLFLSVLYFEVCFGVSAQDVLLGTKKDMRITDNCSPRSMSVNLSIVKNWDTIF